MSDAKREPLPETRSAITKKFTLKHTIDGQPAELKLYVTAGMYRDGKLGEVFIKADRQGSFVAGALDGVAMMMSIALQHGVPLKDLTSKLRGMQFEPRGFTGDPEVHSCTSPLDLIAHWLELRFGR